jgi:predicted double-glycine peptidase
MAAVKTANCGIGINSWCQTDSYSCGYAAAATLLKHFCVTYKTRELWRELAPCPDNGVTTAALLGALRARNLTAARWKLTAANLAHAYAAGLPVLLSARLDTQPPGDEHWMVAAGYRNGSVLLLNQPSVWRQRVWWSAAKLRRRSSEDSCWAIRAK